LSYSFTLLFGAK